jgi:hypothetical protein
MKIINGKLVPDGAPATVAPVSSIGTTVTLCDAKAPGTTAAVPPKAPGAVGPAGGTVLPAVQRSGATEESVGITHFTTRGEGWDGIIKHR